MSTNPSCVLLVHLLHSEHRVPGAEKLQMCGRQAELTAVSAFGKRVFQAENVTSAIARQEISCGRHGFLDSFVSKASE